jgi:hypothetical protein
MTSSGRPRWGSGSTATASTLRVRSQAYLVLVFHINPPALPPGAGVQIATSFTTVRPGLARSSIASGLVYASPQCTGS